MMSTRAIIRSSSLTLICLCAAACGNRSVLVPSGPHRSDLEPKPIRVRKPPPPVQVEVMPLRRNEDCFYLDGYFRPKGSNWIWVKGRWVVPPEGCYYAPPATAYESLDVGTTLVHRPGYWHPDDPEEKTPCEQPQECPATNLQ